MNGGRFGGQGHGIQKLPNNRGGSQFNNGRQGHSFNQNQPFSH
jgi:hypothetical protein